MNNQYRLLILMELLCYIFAGLAAVIGFGYINRGEVIEGVYCFMFTCALLLFGSIM